MTAEHNPPSNALFNGTDDLMVKLSAVQIENNRYAGSEQYHGI